MANLKHGTIIDGGLIYNEGLGPPTPPVTVYATSVAVDLNDSRGVGGSYFEADLQLASGNITICLFYQPPSSGVSTFTLKIIQSSTARQFNWGSISNVKWPGGSGPTISASNNSVDILSFTTWDTGTSWYGRVIGHDFQL